MSNIFTNDPTVPSIRTPDCGSFFVKREHDIHLGIDIYLPAGTEVIVPISWKGPHVSFGTVIRVETFTGPNSVPPTPWWNDTKAVFVQSGASRTIYVFGEIETDLKVGDRLKFGDTIGKVVPVLKKDKGFPTSMLHLEMWDNGAWEKDGLLNTSGFAMSSFSLENSGSGSLLCGMGFDGQPRRVALSAVGVERIKAFSRLHLVEYSLFCGNKQVFLRDLGASSLKPGCVYETTTEYLQQQISAKETIRPNSFCYSIPTFPFEKGKALIFLEHKVETYFGAPYDVLTFLDPEEQKILYVNFSFRFSKLLKAVEP